MGTVSQLRPGLIDVQALSAGAACDIDGQCNSGLQCLCKPSDPASGGGGGNPGSPCGPAFSRGVCSTTCETGFCGPGAVCAATVLGAVAGGGDGGKGERR